MFGKLIIVFLICICSIAAQDKLFIGGTWKLTNGDNSTNEVANEITSLLQQNAGICSLLTFTYSSSYNTIRVTLYDKQPQFSDFIKDYFSSDEYDNSNFNVSSIIPKEENNYRIINILITFSLRDVRDYDIVESVSTSQSFEVKDINYELNSVNILENQNKKFSNLSKNASTTMYFNRLNNQIILSNPEMHLEISEFTLVAYMVFLQTLIIVVCFIAFTLIQGVIRDVDQSPRAQMVNILMFLYIGYLLQNNYYFTNTHLSPIVYLFRIDAVNLALFAVMVGVFIGIIFGPFINNKRNNNDHVTIAYKIILALLLLFSPASWNIYIIAYAFTWQIYSMFTKSIKQPIQNFFYDLFYFLFVLFMIYLMRFVKLVQTPFNKTTEHSLLIFVLISHMIFNLLNHRFSLLDLIARMRILRVEQKKFVEQIDKCAVCKQSIKQIELIQKQIASGEIMDNNIVLTALCGHNFHKSCSKTISGKMCPIDKISLGQHFGQ